MRVTRDGVNRIFYCKYINQALVFLNRSHATLLTKGIFITASTRRQTVREMCEICIVTTFFLCVGYWPVLFISRQHEFPLLGGPNSKIGGTNRAAGFYFTRLGCRSLIHRSFRELMDHGVNIVLVNKCQTMRIQGGERYLRIYTGYCFLFLLSVRLTT